MSKNNPGGPGSVSWAAEGNLRVKSKDNSENNESDIGFIFGRGAFADALIFLPGLLYKS